MQYGDGRPVTQAYLGIDTHGVTTQSTSYFEAEAKKRYSFCYDREGWGPLSSTRYDFTPCFLDIWILSVSVYGILFGVAAAWWLLRKNAAQSIPKNWHFYAKLVSCFRYIITAGNSDN